MSVIADFQIPSSAFELGRILTVEGGASIELETIVPTGRDTVPLFWVYNSDREHFVDNVQRHPAVDTAMELDVFDDRTLFTLDWDASRDYIFEGLLKSDGQLLGATGTADTWKFELRFHTHDNLSTFTTHCESAQIPLEVTRVYNPTKPGAGQWYGLTEPQFEALTLAVEMGYYDIPRGCTTKELAEKLGISDQAVTERLRRAILTLAKNTLIVSDAMTDE